MPRSLRTLNIATCGAVLMAVGWWGWSEWRDAQPRLMPLAQPAEVEEVMRGVAEWQDECQAILDTWDSGGAPDSAERIGTTAADTVGRCRAIVRMRPQVWATD